MFCAAPRRRANKTGEQIGPAAWLIRIRTATARAEMAPQQQQLQRPNVLILLSDQHSKMQLGCAGDEVVRTPALDRLAAEGMLFTNCYTPAPVCVPARMSFMSTLTPSRNEVWGNKHCLNSAIPTWPHSLGAAGYSTALIGRMHFVGSDQRHGFEHRPLGEYGSRHPGTEALGGPLFIDSVKGTAGQIRKCVEIAGYGTTTYQAFDDMVCDETCAWLQQHSRKPGDTELPTPFAVTAGFLLPHCPFFCPQELFEYYFEKVQLPSVADQIDPSPIARWKVNRDMVKPLTDHQVRVARAAYYGLCEYLDTLIGKIMRVLDESGLAENTLVIYTSDHGEAAGEHGCWWKSNYYEASVGIPLIARWPRTIAPGQRCDALASLTDVGATAIDVGRAQPLPGSDGCSLLPHFTGRPELSKRSVVFSELGGSSYGLALQYEPPSRMIREGTLKLYQYGDEEPVLYDLASDPGELSDLAQHIAYQQQRKRLLALLHEGWSSTRVKAREVVLKDRAQIISSWGNKVAPVHDDTLPVPWNVWNVARM